MLFGLLALRTRGSYFLMITLALSQVLWGVAFGWRSLTGGDDGLPEVPRPDLGLPNLGLGPLTDSIPFYYFVLFFVTVGALLLVRIVNSPFGHALARHPRERNPDAGARLQRLALQAHGVRAGRHLRRPGRLPLCLLQSLRQSPTTLTSPAPPRCC